MGHRKYWLGSAAIVALVACGPVYAQGATDDPQSAAEGGSSGLEEIVVTARKRTESLQDIPVAISAFSAEKLDERGVRSVADLASAVPSVAMTGKSDGNFNPNIIVRGISSSARNVGFESSLGVYVDGVFMGRTSGFDQDLSDVERVEVLRGPQGTLFGKNTIAGAISIVTTDPSSTPRFAATADIGNYALRSGSIAVSGPLTETLSAKISVYGLDRDGYVENLNSAGTGPETVGDMRAWTTRAALRWAPNDAIDIQLRGDYGRTRGHIFEREILAGIGTTPGRFTIDQDAQGLEKRTLGGVSLTANVELGSDLQLTSISAWRTLRYGAADYDVDSTPLDLLTAELGDRLNQYSQELRLASSGSGPLSFVGGLFFSRQNANSNRLFELGEDVGFEVATRIRSRVTTSSIAAFLNADYRLTDTLSVNAGGRFTSERKTLRYAQEGGDLLGYPSLSFRDRQSDKDMSVTMSLNYKPVEDMLLYLKYSTGFKSGGWNADIRGTGGAPFTADALKFDPESIESFEAGYKLTAWDRRLRLNVAAYYMRYKDIQISEFIGGLAGFKTTNAGRAHSKGIEVELAVKPVPALELSGGFGINHARYDEYPSAGVGGQDLSGTRMLAPKFTGSFAADLTQPLGAGDLIAGLSYTVRSAFPANPLDPNSGTDSQNTIDGRLGYRWASGLEVYAWVKNLFNDSYFDGRGTMSNLEIIGQSQIGGVYGAPRTYGLRLGYRF